jgi:hypothetical protein
MTRVTAAAAAALLALGVAACGDDDTDATTDTTEASTDTTGAAAGGDTGAFCDALVDFNTAVIETDLDGAPEDEVKAAGEDLAPLFDTIAENAPESLADPAAELNEAVQALLDGDAEGFNEDSTFDTYNELVSGAVGECGFANVEVTGVDYAFEGVPASLPAGTTSFSFTNASEAEEHEMILARRAPGVDLTFDEILALPEEESEPLVKAVAFSFAPPGGESGALAELEPGEYVMVCFVSVGGAEDGPPHFTQGMKYEFTVEDA